jgi:hypothetical protein
MVMDIRHNTRMGERMVDIYVLVGLSIVTRLDAVKLLLQQSLCHTQIYPSPRQ